MDKRDSNKFKAASDTVAALTNQLRQYSRLSRDEKSIALIKSTQEKLTAALILCAFELGQSNLSEKEKTKDMKHLLGLANDNLTMAHSSELHL